MTDIVEATHDQLGDVAACLFESGDIIELRRLPSGRSSWHRADELPGQADGLAAENRSGQHVFFGANPRTAAGKTKADGVSLARCVFADFDGCDVADARRRIDDASLPAPTMLVRSGGGVHAWWRLSDAMTDLSLWTRYQRGLAAILDSDGKVCDAPRIMRLPGFLNLKYQPSQPCEIVEAVADRVYSLDEFADVLNATPEEPARTPHGNADGTIPEGMRDATLFRLGCSMRAKGFGKSAILAALLVHNTDHCVPPLSRAQVAAKARQAAKYDADVPTIGAAETTAPWKPFPVECLPGTLHVFVVEQSAALPCDPVMVAIPAIATCGAAIGLSRRIRVKSTWTEWPIIWGVVVSHSGTLKSPAFDAALEPLRKIQEARYRDHEAEIDTYDSQRAIYDAEFADWKRPARNGENRDEPPDKPEEPTCVRHIVQDCTIESLAPLLRDNPRGLLVARDELSGWLGSFNQYKGGKGSDVANWLEAHRAGALTVDRKSAARPVLYIPHGAISVTGSIQPTIIRKALTPELRACGLAPRLLMAAPPRLRKRWTEDDVSPATKQRYADTIRALSEIELPMADGIPEPLDLRLSAAAQANWKTYYNRFAGEQNEASDSLASAFAKIEGYALRLALIFELVKNPQATVVGAESLHEAITVADWFAYEARRVYGLWGVADDDDGADPLVATIRENGGRLTVRELQRKQREYRSDAKTAAAALQRLADTGRGCWVDESPSPKGGKPSRVFVLNPTGDTGDGANTLPNGTASGGIVTVTTVTTPENESEPDRLGAALNRNGQWE